MRKSVKIKADLHALIDKVDNNELLEVVYQLLNSKTADNDKSLLEGLTAEQRKELYTAYDESFDESNLVDLERLKIKHRKWQKFNSRLHL